MKYRKAKPKASDYYYQSQSKIVSKSTREKVNEQAMIGFAFSDASFLNQSKAAQALYQITLDVTLGYKRCCVTKIRFIRVCTSINALA